MSMIWLRVSVALYLVGLVDAIATILSRRSRWFRLALSTFSVGVIVHAVSLVEEGFWLGQVPLNGFQQSASLCAFLLALLFLIVYWRYRFASLGVFMFPLVFVMALASSLQTPGSHWSSPTVRDAWLVVHIALVLSGYAALLLMAAASLVYLAQERHLKKKTPLIFFSHLPPLGTLDELISRYMAIGFVLITLSIIAGSTWAFVESGTQWIREPKIVISLVTWACYLVMVFLRVSAGWRGRRAALMAVTVVGFSALTWAAHAGLRGMLVR